MLVGGADIQRLIVLETHFQETLTWLLAGALVPYWLVAEDFSSWHTWASAYILSANFTQSEQFKRKKEATVPFMT